MSAVFQKICALLLIVVLGLTGCTSSAAQPNQLAIGELSDPSTFNPVLNDVATDFFNYTFQGLVNENDDGKGKAGPGLAESWKTEGNTITYTLRPNLKWSDGKPLTVDDVDFSFNDVYFNLNILSSAQDSLKIGEDQKFPTVKKIDNRHIAITTPEPFAPALLTIGGQAILPAHILKPLVEAEEIVQERKDYKDAQGKKQFKMVPKKRSKFMGAWGINTRLSELVGNGMYKLVSYTPGERLIFERNPYYWRKDAEGKQLPYIDRMVWQISENTDNMLMQFRSKNVDTYRTAPDFFSLLKKEEKKGDFKIFNAGPSNGTSFLTFNQNKGSRKGKPLVNPVKSRWFNNVKFRQAVAYAIDRQRIINNLYRGLGALQNSPISVGTPFYLNDIKSYSYDLVKAKEFLVTAGFKYKGNDLYDDQDNRVEFNLITNAENKFRVAMGAQIQQDLEKLGIKANFEPIAFSLLNTKMGKSLEWDALILSFFGSGVDPHDGINVWRKDGRLHAFNQTPDMTDKDTVPVTGQEVAPWEQEISDLYIKGAQELDEAKRKEIYYQTQRLTQENLPFIYLVNSLSLHAIRNNLTGVKPSNLGQLWNLYEVKVQNAAMAAAK
jgi:peptide/nickel transport system substrate-binding protein